ncbi:MAG: hypothetical protein AAFV29_01870, partial [Myxococcota bacterium]
GLGTFGCDQDTRVPRAEFRRPTGLSYLQRPSEFNCPATPLVDGAIIDGLTRNQRQLSNAVRIDSTDDLLSGVRQGTLLIADAEAEGVRVIHYQQSAEISSDNGTATERLILTERELVPGPTVFFPLVLSTPGFPTVVTSGLDTMRFSAECVYPAEYQGLLNPVDEETGLVLLGDDGLPLPPEEVTVDLTPDDDSATFTVNLERDYIRGARSYVLANEGGPAGASAAVYAIDSRPRPFRSRSDDYAGFAAGKFDLGDFDETAGAWTSVDLQAVAYGGCEPESSIEDTTLPQPCDAAGYDVLALLQDSIGIGFGRLVFMTVDRAGGAPSFVSVRLPQGSRPTNIAVRENNLLINDSARRFVYQVPFTVTSSIPTVGDIREIDVDGPTSRVVDGGILGVFAVRLDVSRLVHLEERGSGNFARGGVRLSTPFAYDPDPDNPLRLGQIDLRESPVLSGELGESEELQQSVDGVVFEALQDEDFFGRRAAPILMVAHADAVLSYVIGSPPRLAELRSNQINVLRRLEDDQEPVEILGCEPPMFEGDSEDDPPTDDPDGPIPACFPAGTLPLACNDRQVSFIPSPSTEVYRFTYRGPVLRSDTGTAAVDVTVVDTATSATVRIPELTISANPPDLGAVALGDLVLLQISREDGTDTSTASFVIEGTVTATDSEDSGAVEIEVLTLVEPELQGEEIVDEVRSFDVLDCDAPPCLFDVQRLEVYPENEEGVLTRRIAGRIAEVLQRTLPVSSGEGGLIRYSFQGEQLSGGPLPVTFDVEVTTDGALAPQDEGRICGLPDECPEDFECVTDLAFDDEGNPDPIVRSCFNRCRPSACPVGATCVDRRFERTGVEFRVQGAATVLTQLIGPISGGVTGTALALPDDAVYAPLLRAWLISVPGTRTLAEVAPITSQIAVGTTR